MADTVLTTSPRHPTSSAIGVVLIDYSGGDQAIVKPARGIHINTAGTLKVDFSDGSTATLTLGVGLWPYEIRKIYQTGSLTAAGYVLV